MRRIQRNLRATVVSLAGCLLLVLLEWTVPESISGILVSLTFLATVLAAGILGGWKFGIATTLLAFLAALFLFSPPYLSYVAANPVKLLRLISFALLGVIFSVFCELLRNAWSRIEMRQRQLEDEVNERRRSQLAEHARAYELMTTLASIGDGVIRTDSEGRVRYMNPVAEELVGWASDRAAGYLLPDVFQIANEMTRRPVENPAIHALRNERTTGLANDSILVSKSGKERPIEHSAAPIQDASGKVIGSVLVFRDLSHLKRVEAELRETDRRKDEFLAILAHELRNPLAAIVNSLQVLRMPTVNVEIVHRSSEMMERQVHQLVRLVDDLLDVSRAMRGRIELRLERVELATVVAHAVETVQSMIRAKGHRLEMTIPTASLTLNADAVRLAQVVGNLLTNAAKYTAANGLIRLTARQEGDQAVLSVQDNGIGIDPEMLPHIFELFVQADHSSTKSQGGLGVGLTLVRNLIEMHGGTVHAYSAGLGQGSEFEIHLPLASETGENMAQSGSEQFLPTPRSSCLRLLVVDDNQDVANSLATLLLTYGHEVRIAYTGTDALEIVSSDIPHIVLMDIGMPVMDGYEVARRIRKMPGLETTVLVAVTGWGQTEDRRRTAEAGFDHHLLKPLKPHSLESILADRSRSLPDDSFDIQKP